MSAPQQPGLQRPPRRARSRVVAGLLNLFLGGFGIGDFYLGYTQYAIYKIVISLVLVVPAVVLDLGFISTIFSLLYYAWASSARRGHHDLPGQVDLREGRQRRSHRLSCACVRITRALTTSRAGPGNMPGPAPFIDPGRGAPGLIRDGSGWTGYH